MENESQNSPLPIRYEKARAWFSVFACSRSRAEEQLPDPLLSPALIVPGLSALVVAVFDFEDSSIGPYREVGIGVPCRYRRSTAIPLVPLLAEKYLDDVGPWVNFMAVSTQVANDAGRRYWGYPKFVADIDIQADDAQMRCVVKEKGEKILEVNVDRPARSGPIRFPVRTYTQLADELLLTEFHVDAMGSIRRLGAKARVRFEDHPRAASLRELRVAGSQPIEVRWCDVYRTEIDRARARYRIGV